MTLDTLFGHTILPVRLTHTGYYKTRETHSPRALSPSGFAFNGFLDCTLPYFFFFFSQEIERYIRCSRWCDDGGGGGGGNGSRRIYLALHQLSNYLCLFPRISKSKITRSDEKQRSNRVNGNSFTELLNHRVTKSRFNGIVCTFLESKKKKEKKGRSMIS